MANRIVLISIAGALCLGAGLAYAAPRAGVARRPGTARPKPARRPGKSAKRPDCAPRPSKDDCIAEGYLEVCGKKWSTICKDAVGEKVEAHYLANPSPEVKMFKPNRDDIPGGLRLGKTDEYLGPKTKADLLGTFPTVKTTRKVAASKKTSTRPMAKKARGAKLNGTAANRLAKKRGGTIKLSKFKPGPLRVMTSDNIFSRTGLTRPPQSGLGTLPVNAHRVPAWDANGAKVKSCEEYGYEQTYDWARYTDAVAACSGDHNCQIDVALLSSTPGIADRTLRSKDGTPLKTQLKTKKGFSLPKNDFFAPGSKFARATGGKRMAQTPDLEALEKALDAGDKYYTVGCKGACRTPQEFKSEWTWHRELHHANRKVTEAEFGEYELRKERLRDLLIRWNWAAAEERAHLTRKAARGKAHQFVSPLDQVANPIQRLRNLRGSTRKLQRAGKKLRGGAGRGSKAGRRQVTPLRRGTPSNRAAPNNRAGGGARGAAKRGAVGQVGALDPAYNESSPAVAVLGFNKPGGPKPGTTPAGAKAKANQLVTPRCHPSRFKSGINELFGEGPISCEIGYLLREEWKRKQAGERTCLDLGNDGCDWSPKMFEQRFVEGVPYIKEQHEAETYCLDYTFDNINQPTLKVAREYIEEQEAAVRDELEKLAPYMTGWDPAHPEAASPRAFGKGWTDADHFGDKSLFAAGYHYDLGWDIEAVKVAKKKKKKLKDVCDLGGGARGSFGVSGWFIGERTEIIDAKAKLDYGRKGDDKGAVEAHFRIMEQDMFVPYDPTIDAGKTEKNSDREVVKKGGKFSGSWEGELFSGAVQVPPSYKPSFYVMAGPIPVSGSVWGEFFYGANLAVEVVNKAENCDMSKLELGVTATFTPQVGLNAKAQVGVGIAGLLSAGIRGMVNLVTVGVPVESTMSVLHETDGNGAHTDLNFDLDVRLSLETLSGWIAVYIEILLYEEEFVIFRWNGVGPESISLFGNPLNVKLPLGVMARG